MRTAVWMAVVAVSIGPILFLDDQHTHVKTTSNAGTGEGLVSTVLLTDGHETGHLNLGELDLAATEGGEGLEMVNG
jgi:hypothetical protein